MALMTLLGLGAPCGVPYNTRTAVTAPNANERKTMRRAAIVIVTFKRQELLASLLDSVLSLTVAPWRVVVVDNENSELTARVVGDFERRAEALWGATTDDPDSRDATSRTLYVPMETNTGGSGGFSEGVRQAYELGAEWFWVMDDDVAVEPDGLETLARWSEEAEAVMGQRRDFDGGHFYFPFVGEFAKEVDVEGKRMVIEVVEGML